MRKLSNARIIKKRSDSIHRGHRSAKCTPTTKRPGIMDCRVKKHPGYELLPSQEPVYTYDTAMDMVSDNSLHGLLSRIEAIQHMGIKTQLKHALKNNFPNDLLAADHLIHNHLVDMQTIERNYVDSIDFGDIDDGFWQDVSCTRFSMENIWRGDRFISLSQKPCIAVTTKCRIASPGAFIINKVLDNDNIEMLAVMMIFYKLLGVGAWWGMDFKPGVDACLSYCVSTNPDHEMDLSYWRKNKRKQIDLYHMGKSVSVGSVIEAEKQWDIASDRVIKIFNDLFDNFPYEKVEALRNKNKVFKIWFDAVMWLVKEGFEIYDYMSMDEMESDGEVPIYQSFCILYADDNYLAAIDEATNSSYEGGSGSLSTTVYYFKDGILSPAGKDYKKKMMVFTSLYNLVINKTKFHDDKAQQYLQSHCDSVHILEWQAVLCRAIASSRRKSVRSSKASG